MNIGIICEYNPFHNGHLYHLKKIKEMYPNSNIILVIDGWITQRGDLSLISKFKKAKTALEYGIDLVVELPIKYIQSADYFAKGALAILNSLNCDILVFGSESNNIDKLKKLAYEQINNKELNTLLKEELTKGLNYPTALSNTLYKLTKIKVAEANDLLGISYIKEIISNNYNITPITIKRTNNYNSKNTTGNISSATSIRELIKNNKDIKRYIPNNPEYLKNSIFLEDYFNLIKYKIITQSDLTIYQGIDIKLNNRIHKYIECSNTLDELINNIKSKNYTYNRIKRCLLFILLGIKKDEFKNYDLEYIRVLGFNNKGKNILNKCKKNIKLLTKYDKNYLEKDLEITKILSINDKIQNKSEFISLEYKSKPIMVNYE